eukprot:4209283-Pyramimonas_sp.AAC.1
MALRSVLDRVGREGRLPAIPRPLLPRQRTGRRTRQGRQGPFQAPARGRAALRRLPSRALGASPRNDNGRPR